MKKIKVAVLGISLLGLSSFALADMNKESCGFKSENHKGYEQRMYKKHHNKKMKFLKIVRKLNLSDEQKKEIRAIIKEKRAQKSILSQSLTETNFDQAKFLELSSKKRENMLKSKAETMAKIYAVLTTEQKKQLKVLVDLKMR